MKSEKLKDMSDKYEILEVNAQDIIEGVNIDAQVSTAKKYPRDITRSINNSITMATMNEDVARSCSYALVKSGKYISGPSVHLAKIIVSNWGNMRTDAKVVRITDKQIISRGTCWDLEANVASAFEVRMPIVDYRGNRYSDDIITTTGNASNAIAYRNSVFAVIPRPIIDSVINAAKQLITGDLTDHAKLINKRDAILTAFANDYNIDEQSILKIIGKQSNSQINAEHIYIMCGILQSLRDGDTTVSDLTSTASEKKKDSVDRKKTVIKSKNNKIDLP